MGWKKSTFFSSKKLFYSDKIFEKLQYFNYNNDKDY